MQTSATLVVRIPFAVVGLNDKRVQLHAGDTVAYLNRSGNGMVRFETACGTVAVAGKFRFYMEAGEWQVWDESNKVHATDLSFGAAVARANRLVELDTEGMHYAAFQPGGYAR